MRCIIARIHILCLKYNKQIINKKKTKKATTTMSLNEIRTQRQREQDERRLSLQRNNAYFSYVSDTDRSITPNPTNSLLPTTQERARSCSPSLLSFTQNPLSTNSREFALCLPTVTSTVTSIITASAITTTTGTVSSARSISSSTASALAEPAIKTKTNANGSAALPAKQNVNKNAGSTLQTGMDRYITIKRKLSPQNSKAENKQKTTRGNINLITDAAPANSNRFSLLADTAEDLPQEPVENEVKK